MDPTHASSPPLTPTAPEPGRAARRITLAVTIACVVLLGVFLLRGHTAGGELLGPVAAVVGIAAGVLSLASGGAKTRRSVVIAVVLLWTAVVLLGVAGTLDHAKPVKPEYTDQRPRPAYVPLVFSLIGGAGIAAAVRAPGRPELRVGWPDGKDQR